MPYIAVIMRDYQLVDTVPLTPIHDCELQCQRRHFHYEYINYARHQFAVNMNDINCQFHEVQAPPWEITTTVGLSLYFFILWWCWRLPTEILGFLGLSRVKGDFPVPPFSGSTFLCNWKFQATSVLEEDFLVAAGGALHDALQSGEAQ